MSLRVILKENVEHLGRIGDVVRVSSGYARNYLIPRNLVALASEGQIRELEHHKKVLEKKRKKMLADAEAMAERLNSVKLNYKRKVSDKEQLFGSVTAQDIHESLLGQGIQLEKKSIQLHDPLKALGTFSVVVRVQSDVSAAVKVTISKE